MAGSTCGHAFTAPLIVLMGRRSSAPLVNKFSSSSGWPVARAEEPKFVREWYYHAFRSAAGRSSVSEHMLKVLGPPIPSFPKFFIGHREPLPYFVYAKFSLNLPMFSKLLFSKLKVYVLAYRDARRVRKYRVC